MAIISSISKYVMKMGVEELLRNVVSISQQACQNWTSFSHAFFASSCIPAPQCSLDSTPKNLDHEDILQYHLSTYLLGSYNKTKLFGPPFAGLSFSREKISQDIEVANSKALENTQLDSQALANAQLDRGIRTGQSKEHNDLPQSAVSEEQSEVQQVLHLLSCVASYCALIQYMKKNIIINIYIQEKWRNPVSKEELGRATWIFLHSIAAQFPDKPTKQQQRDAKELMAIISRLYPCKECANHFKEILKTNPVQASSGLEFSRWMCHIHNIVNRSLGKPTFPCQRVDARWGSIACEEGCDLQGRVYIKP